MPVALLLLLTACIPVPTPEHSILSGRAMIGDNDIQRLVAGKGDLTREDILLELGDPNKRFDQDKYFCYGWQRTQAYVFLPYAAGEMGQIHWLCMQFDNDSRLILIEHIEPSVWDVTFNGENAVPFRWWQAHPQTVPEGKE